MKPTLDSPFLDGEWATPADEAERGGTPDVRRVRDTRVPPFRWVCRISIQRRIVRPGGGSTKTGLAPAGSGLLITPRHVLTAAHVLSTPADAGQDRHETLLVSVAPGHDDGAVRFGSVEAERWVLHPRWTDSARGTAHDLALITLARPIGSERFDGRPLGCWGSTPGHGWLGDMPAALSARLLELPIATAGYPGSASGRMVTSTSRLQLSAGERRALAASPQLVSTLMQRRPVFAVDAGATGGQSGSPLWVDAAGRRHLVGVLVDAASGINHAVALTAPVQRLVQSWIDGTPAQREFEGAPAADFEREDATEPEHEAFVPRRAAGRLPDAEAADTSEAALAGPGPDAESGAHAAPDAGAGAAFEFEPEPESEGEPEPDPRGEAEVDPEVLLEDEFTAAQAREALARAIAGGERDETRLTNQVFFARHPELDPRRALDPVRVPADAALAREWARIRDREVWAAIQAAARDPVLKVHGQHVANGHREFWGADGRRFRDLVEWAAREVDLHPGLLAAALISETGGRRSYLRTGAVDSYHLGLDDYYALRQVLADHVPAAARVGWNRRQKPEVHLNDAQSRPREVQTIRFDSGRDGLLATAVYLKYAEVRLRSDAARLGGDFDRLPLPTRLALIRTSMAAGRGGAAKRLAPALQGRDILVRNWAAPKAYQTGRNATIRAAQALHLDAWFFGGRAVAPAGGLAPAREFEDAEAFEPGAVPEPAFAPEVEAAGLPEIVDEAFVDGLGQAEDFTEDELEHLGVLEHQVPPAPAAAPTIGFEFDLNHGFEQKVVDAMGLGPPPGWRWPFEGAPATDHVGRDAAGRLADGFVVKMDAVRLEIATVPVRIDDDAEFSALAANVVAFGRELQAAEKTLQRDTPVPGVQGRPLLLHHPRTVVNQADAGAPGGLKTRREPVPLVIHRLFGRYPTATALWAAPQATLTLPLAEFGKLVWEIHRTMGAAPGVALTGPAGARLGLRDDLAWKALKIAVAERKRRVGSRLADGSVVTEAMFSRALTSALTILLMYMLTGTDVDPRDAGEPYAKGSLPLNLKTPLWAVHRHALNDDERRLLRELYTGPDRRAALFALVPRRPPGSGTTPLFPARTDGGLRVVFDAPPTWDTLVDAFADEQPVRVTKANRLRKKGHKPGDEILIAPLSSKIDWDRTAPRIAVELRRIGFAPVGLAHWTGLMDRLRTLARRVNP